MLILYFWIGIMLIYFPAYQAGFYTDFKDTLEAYKQYGFVDFINRKGIDNLNLYQATQVLLYCFISLFKTNPVPWFLLFTAMHAFNGYLIYKFFIRFFNKLGWVTARTPVLFGVVFFLVAPSAAQVVI